MMKLDYTAYNPCIICGEYVPENEAHYLGTGERELWICHRCHSPKGDIVRIRYERPEERDAMFDQLAFDAAAGRRQVVVKP